MNDLTFYIRVPNHTESRFDSPTVQRSLPPPLPCACAPAHLPTQPSTQPPTRPRTQPHAHPTPPTRPPTRPPAHLGAAAQPQAHGVVAGAAEQPLLLEHVNHCHTSLRVWGGVTAKEVIDGSGRAELKVEVRMGAGDALGKPGQQVSSTLAAGIKRH